MVVNLYEKICQKTLAEKLDNPYKTSVEEEILFACLEQTKFNNAEIRLQTARFVVDWLIQKKTWLEGNGYNSWTFHLSEKDEDMKERYARDLAYAADPHRMH